MPISAHFFQPSRSNASSRSCSMRFLFSSCLAKLMIDLRSASCSSLQEKSKGFLFNFTWDTTGVSAGTHIIAQGGGNGLQHGSYSPVSGCLARRPRQVSRCLRREDDSSHAFCRRPCGVRVVGDSLRLDG